MKTTMLRSLALLFVLSPLVARATAPANDKFANASPFNGRSVTLVNQTGVGATAEAFDPYIGGIKPTHSVWYRFDGLFAINTNHIIITHQAAANIAVFSLNDADGGIGSLTLATGAQPQKNNAAAGIDTLTFTTTGPTLGYVQRYYVCVDTASTFGITLQLPGQTNDFFADAIALTNDPGTNQGSTTGSNLNCTDTGDTPAVPNGTPPLKSGVWYRWTSTYTGQMAFDTNFSYLAGTAFHNTAIDVFTGTGLGTLGFVTSDTSNGTGTGGAVPINNGYIYTYNSRVSFAATSGTTYYIWVGTGGVNGDGPFNLEWFPETSSGVFDLVAADHTAYDNQGTATFQVRRRFAGNLVTPSVTAGSGSVTAHAGTDYVTVNQTLTFGSGQSPFLQTFDVTFLPRTAPGPGKSFNVMLLTPTNGSLLGTGSPSTISIYSQQIIVPGFESPTASASASDSDIVLPITRSNSTGEVNLSIGTNFNGYDTAIEGIDYFLPSTYFSMAAGQTTAFVEIIPISSAVASGTRTLSLFISPQTSGLPVDGSTGITITLKEPNAPQPAAGRFSAILAGYGNSLGASLDCTISATGAATGKVTMDRNVFPFTGKFDSTGLLTVNFGPPGTAPTRTLTLQLLDSATQAYEAILMDNVLGAEAAAVGAGTSFSAISPCPQAGLYSFTDGGDGADIPHYTAATLKVDALGNATLSGHILDGTAFTASGAVDASGNADVGASLYAGQGRLTASTPLSLQQELNTGTLVLNKPGPADQNVVQGNLANVSATILVAPYTPPAANTRALTIWNGFGMNPPGAGKASFTAGGFGALTTQTISVSTKNVITTTGANPYGVKLTLTPATGLFTGSVKPPGAAAALPIYGVLFQTGVDTGGTGFFLNNLTPGKVTLSGP